MATTKKPTLHGRKGKRGVTHHGKPGLHGYKMPAEARRDAWKHKGQAQGQG